ncbi:MAG TPA: primosomal protein N', partial [Myxococcota bacterium]|nr:primosomal protein N' [Myxococcota bacterium]
FAPPGEAVSLLLPPRMADGEEAPKERLTRFVRRLGGEPPRSGVKMREVLAWLEKNGDASADTLRTATGVAYSTLRRMVELGLIAIDESAQNRDPLAGISLASLKTAGGVHPLTPAQRQAADEVFAAFGTYRGFLLHGVTGSGKTEVYLDLIERALSRNQGSLVLVPEIALTPQLVARFRARLGERVAVQHSGLDPSARHEQWLRIRAGELPVVVGARSALFSPIRELGLVIVDEEHEGSFKQETSPRYHARDLALVLGHLAKCPVVLGSATPSLESWANVAKKKLTKLSLPERAHQLRPLPGVSVIDMREVRQGNRSAAGGAPSDKAQPDSPFSPRLVLALRETLTSGDQALIFLNRRGYASFVQCRTCGKTLDCASCSVTFTWHRRRQRLICHYCDASRPMPPSCPSCRKDDLVELGHGTEQLEDRLSELLPTARIGRMDRDTTRGKSLIKLLARFRKGELDVLIGTQMLAKGHDFPGVTLVGVLSAEHGLAFPDPRAAERTFQLLTQIAGRAGRGDRPGRVLIQTRMPDHYAISRAVEHDVTGFLDTEMALREARGFPPHTHLALFRLSGRDFYQTEALGRALVEALRQTGTPGRAPAGTSIAGPQPAPIERVKDRFRFQVLVRAAERRDLRRALDLSRAFWSARHPGDLQIALDVDPHSFL